MKRAIKKTKFLNHKTFRNDSDAKKYMELLMQRNPDVVYQIKKRSFPNKLKLRFTVRSIAK